MPNRAFNTDKILQQKLPIAGTMIYHCVLHDKRLDAIDKLLHSLMRTFPDDWHFNATDLAKRIGVSRKTVDRSLARLMAASLLDRDPARGEGGIFLGYIYSVYPVRKDLYNRLVRQMKHEYQGPQKTPLDKND